MRNQPAPAVDDRLLLTAAEAARLLSLSRKSLYNHTAPRGDGIPVIRIGNSLRYSRVTLTRWLEQRERGQHC